MSAKKNKGDSNSVAGVSHEAESRASGRNSACEPARSVTPGPAASPGDESHEMGYISHTLRRLHG